METPVPLDERPQPARKEAIADVPDEVSLSPRNVEAYEESKKVLESPDPYKCVLSHVSTLSF